MSPNLAECQQSDPHQEYSPHRAGTHKQVQGCTLQYIFLRDFKFLQGWLVASLANAGHEYSQRCMNRAACDACDALLDRRRSVGYHEQHAAHLPYPGMPAARPANSFTNWLTRGFGHVSQLPQSRSCVQTSRSSAPGSGSARMVVWHSKSQPGSSASTIADMSLTSLVGNDQSGIEAELELVMAATRRGSTTSESEARRGWIGSTLPACF